MLIILNCKGSANTIQVCFIYGQKYMLLNYFPKSYGK